MRTREQEYAAYNGLRISRIAAELDCSIQHVHNLIRAGAFGEVINIGTAKKPEYRISREAYERFLQERTVGAGAQ